MGPHLCFVTYVLYGSLHFKNVLGGIFYYFGGILMVLDDILVVF